MHKRIGKDTIDCEVVIDVIQAMVKNQLHENIVKNPSGFDVRNYADLVQEKTSEMLQDVEDSNEYGAMLKAVEIGALVVEFIVEALPAPALVEKLKQMQQVEEQVNDNRKDKQHSSTDSVYKTGLGKY